MATTKETEVARKAVTVINSGAAEHGGDAEEILDTVIKVFFAQRSGRRLMFCLTVLSHAFLNIVKEGWRKLSGKLDW